MGITRPGKHTKGYWKLPFSSWIYPLIAWWFSIVMWLFTRGYSPIALYDPISDLHPNICGWILLMPCLIATSHPLSPLWPTPYLTIDYCYWVHIPNLYVCCNLIRNNNILSLRTFISKSSVNCTMCLLLNVISLLSTNARRGVCHLTDLTSPALIFSAFFTSNWIHTVPPYVSLHILNISLEQPPGPNIFIEKSEAWKVWSLEIRGKTSSDLMTILEIRSGIFLRLLK